MEEKDLWGDDDIEIEPDEAAEEVYIPPESEDAQKEELTTYADIVFCIDATASMTEAMKDVKENAIGLHAKVKKALDDAGRKVQQMRIKVIVYRDIYVDTVAFEESEFFTVPEEEVRFKAFVEKFEPQGGGDEPESGLEALAKAINVDWVQGGARRRHIIIMMTDASPHPLDHPKRSLSDVYPSNMPADLIDIYDMWCKPLNTQAKDSERSMLDQKAKRLVIFGPNCETWNEIGKEWKLANHVVCKPGGGMEGMFDMVITWLVKSMS